MSRNFIVFQGGTLVIYGDKATKQEPLPPPFRLIKERFRCEGYRYSHVQPILESRGIRDQVPRWEPLDLALCDPREPHAYQLEALEACQREQGKHFWLFKPLIVQSVQRLLYAQR
jgi:hypothetical protein